MTNTSTTYVHAVACLSTGRTVLAEDSEGNLLLAGTHAEALRTADVWTRRTHVLHFAAVLSATEFLNAPRAGEDTYWQNATVGADGTVLPTL